TAQMSGVKLRPPLNCTATLFRIAIAAATSTDRPTKSIGQPTQEATSSTKRRTGFENTQVGKVLSTDTSELTSYIFKTAFLLSPSIPLTEKRGHCENSCALSTPLTSKAGPTA